MGEREGGESRSVGAFLLGFLLGVLVTLGGAGSFFMVTQRGGMRAEMALREAEAARAEAERAREMAERARQAEERAHKAEQEAKKRGQKEVKDNGPEPEDKEAKAAEEKQKQARRGVKTLDTAIRAYRTTHREYPNTLDLLTMAMGAKPAALDKAALTDPWGRAYMYERGKTNPRTGIPLIYSLGPDPKDEKGRISNW
jgi:Type II secretion system (T2SS), protein G